MIKDYNIGRSIKERIPGFGNTKNESGVYFFTVEILI